MTHRLSHVRVRALIAGSVATAALATGVAVTSTAMAAPAAAKASCKTISFSVLHNDSSGGVTLPKGTYAVSSPNLSCSAASTYFKTFLNKYNHAIPGWKGKQIAKGWGTYTKNGSSTRFTVKWSKAKGATSAPPSNKCATSALKVSLGKANATAGTTYYPLKFVNKSKASCTLTGYPGVSAINNSGKQIGNSAKRSGAKYRTVTIKPGKQQSSSVGIVDTGNFTPSQCKAVTATGLKIIPPNQAKALVIGKSFKTCSSTASTSLVVKPVK